MMKMMRAPRPLRWILSPVAIVLSFAIVLLFTGCGGANVSGSSDPTTAPTVTIAASASTINAGASVTLTVVATKAVTVTVTGSDGTTYSMSSSGGTQSVTPAATTTYTATATGTGGQTSAAATITVAAAATAPTVTIAANPTTINAGGNSTLTVVATNATTVAIAGSDSSSYKMAATGGTQIVTPAATTTYTVTATGAGGTATATATVTVVPQTTPAPTVTLTATPASINAGSSTTLSVTATNATQVLLTGTDGSTFQLQPAGGTEVVSPPSTATYQVTATGPGGTASASTIVTVIPAPTTTVTMTANPASIISGNAATLTVVATNATTVTISGADGSSYTLPPAGGTQSVSPTSTTTYTATATGTGGKATATATVTVNPPGSINSIDHVIFMLQENHSFDNYFGMLNPYRHSTNSYIGDDGKDYEVDGIDDKLTSISNVDDEGTATYAPFKFATTCVDDMSSAWLESFGDVNRYDFLATRSILMDGFVHNAEGFAKNCASSGTCSGSFTDLTGQRAMGYYDQGFLNYYYYMAAQFAVSNRWFSPVASKSIPNRIATFTGGTTQGLVYDPGADDKLPQLAIEPIFQELDQAGVSWKIYYSATQGFCPAGTPCGSGAGNYPATTFSILSYSYKYMYQPSPGATCTGTTQPSSVVGDPSNSFCVDPNHITPIGTYFTDLKNGTLPSFSFIESGSGINDEHPGSGQSILTGQAQVASIINGLMSSSSWKDSVFFLSYDEGGGPYDHVPPVPGHSNDYTSSSLGTIPDISGVAVNPDSNPSYLPCVPATAPATTHCDLRSSDPGANSGDAATTQGFAAQIGFRLPNIVISPFTRRHYVSSIPMDHTAVIKFVENRFIGSSAHLTARDAAQPDLLDFFDFNAVPWSTPPTPPSPATPQTLGYDPCTPTKLQ